MPRVAVTIFYAIGVVVLLSGCDSHRPTLPLQEHSPRLSAVSRDFTFRGRPVHPSLVEDLVAPLDGSPPKATVIDLDAADPQAERIFYTVSRGSVGYSDLERHGEGGNGPGYFEYRFLGRTSAGTYVLQTASNGGGSGIFMDLVFVRSRVEGSRVLLECLGEYGLGDRDDGTVRLDRHGITISASRYRTQEVMIDLR